MPTIDLASQYAYLAKFNNYDLYYRNYTANNFSGGLNLRIPIFNSVQKAKAQEADADSTIARKQVDLVKNQVSEDALKLQRSLRQLSAARDVAKLEWEVSQGDLEGGEGPGAIGQRQHAGRAERRTRRRRQACRLPRQRIRTEPGRVAITAAYRRTLKLGTSTPVNDRSL